jgi:phosphosulfolactate phosphohydrolase-like enzyme
MPNQSVGVFRRRPCQSCGHCLYRCAFARIVIVIIPVRNVNEEFRKKRNTSAKRRFGKHGGIKVVSGTGYTKSINKPGHTGGRISGSRVSR